MTKLEELKKEIQLLRPETLIERDDGFGSICFLERQITLEDVLFVLGKLEFEELTSLAYYVDDKILKIRYEFGDYYGMSDFEDICSWELGKPLDDQSEKTINSLHNLIFKQFITKPTTKSE